MAKARATAKNAKHPTKIQATPASADHAAATGSQADFDTFLPAARKVSAVEIVPMRADPHLALHNVQVGVASVLAESARVRSLPETDHATFASLPRLALAVIFATTQVAPHAGAVGLAPQLARGNALRALLLKSADSLVQADLLPKAEVDKIRAGHGKLDAARDLVALAALFGKHGATVRGKHPVSAAQLKEAAAVGTELLTLLKSGRARRTSAAPAVGAEERDRLWTLVVQHHDRLWRAGAYLFGRDAVDAKVPSLQASRGGRAKKAAAPAAPVPATGTPK